MSKFLTVVSGLPRSGTSMMMRMLQAGGLPLVSDDRRTADEDNPRGYFEDLRVKKLKDDSAWLADPALLGQGIKVVSLLLYSIPPQVPCRVLFMERHMEEVLASQNKMLVRQNIDPDAVPAALMAQKFTTHLNRVRAWIEQQENLTCCYLRYHDVVADPRAGADEAVGFLGLPLDPEKMAAAVDRSLYRNRK